MDKEVKRLEKKLGYKGCRNCKHQIEPFRMCEWGEKGGDGRVHWICPKWEKRAKIFEAAQDENETETTYKEFEGDYWDNAVEIEYTPDKRGKTLKKGEQE